MCGGEGQGAAGAEGDCAMVGSMRIGVRVLGLNTALICDQRLNFFCAGGGVCGGLQVLADGEDGVPVAGGGGDFEHFFEEEIGVGGGAGGAAVEGKGEAAADGEEVDFPVFGLRVEMR